MGWREEIDVVLQAWIAAESGGGRGGRRWQRVGRARAAGEPGRFVVDVRSTKVTADNADDLCLAGPDEKSIDTGFRVMDVTFEGELLRLRVPEHAALPEAHLWWHKQEPGFLLKKLREGIAGLTDAGLANLLASGEPAGTPLSAQARVPAWLENGQENAYRACLGRGLFLVWGPPGTGKTRVLRSAIGDLLAAGKRVLLVSGTNIAVDNALHETLKERRFEVGEIVRVGPPQLPEIANDPRVSLPLIVRDLLASVEEERRAAAEELREMNDRQERLAALRESLAGFDPVAYERAVALLGTPGRSVAELTAALTRCAEGAARGAVALDDARAALDAAVADAEMARPVLDYWEKIDDLTAEQSAVEQAATRAEVHALTANNAVIEAQAVVAGLTKPNGKVRWRDRSGHAAAQENLNDKLRALAGVRSAAVEARRIADATRLMTEREIARLAADAPLSREEIQRREDTAVQAEEKVRALERAGKALLAEGDRLTAALNAAREASKLVERCVQRGWPALHAEARDLRGATARDSARRQQLQQHHDELQEKYDAMEKDARGEVIGAARLVATTLARFRIVKPVFDGAYDVVLVDEAGAASLPEVLLAVAKAGTCAVLLGDFMQLGPVLPQLKDSERPDIKKWLITDVFRHCGIATPEQARRHPSCVVLDTQHRFGPDVMELANRIAYGGMLKAGANVRPHAPEDPELVLIDTDDLGDLAEVRRDGGGVKGWWPAGMLLSRTLVEWHRENGEAVGVVVPYGLQADATLEALRDVEAGGPLAEVGTAHKFQGREFPIVVFDTVEDKFGVDGWVAQATLVGRGTWQRDGVRLVNVAATRVKHRLYVIASGQRVRNAKPGTALGHFRDLLAARRVRTVLAADLITPPDWDPKPLGPESTALAEVLSRHIKVTDIHDEVTFYRQLTSLIDSAAASVWLWSPWVANRFHQLKLLPQLQAAIDRGVKVVLFTRDPSDPGQQKDGSVAAVKAMRAIGVHIVEVYQGHQKVIVIDEHTVMLGSLNALSHSNTREVMLTTRGAHFAAKLLTELHAQEFSTPPPCGACGGSQVDLRRSASAKKAYQYYWRCYSDTCPAKGKGSAKAWTQPVNLNRTQSELHAPVPGAGL